MEVKKLQCVVSPYYDKLYLKLYVSGELLQDEHSQPIIEYNVVDTKSKIILGSGNLSAPSGPKGQAFRASDIALPEKPDAVKKSPFVHVQITTKGVIGIVEAACQWRNEFMSDR